MGTCHCGGDADTCAEQEKHQFPVAPDPEPPPGAYTDFFVGTCRKCNRPQLVIDRDTKQCAWCRGGK
jgi:hypothetical protein